MKEVMKITDLKDMLKKSGELYAERPAYKIRESEGKYKIISHKEVRDDIDSLGTALIDMGLKGKRIAVIGENRYEWEEAYLAIVCGTGIVVPLDKSLPANELVSVIQRSDAEAIFFSKKYKEQLEAIKFLGIGKLKHLICMDFDVHEDGIYSQKELTDKGRKLIEEGNREFLDAKIDPEKMSMMLFTSGTTSQSKIVALSHKNVCSNVMDFAKVLHVDENDVFLSVLPVHHAFECSVGFLFALYCGAETVFCDGLRHIGENLVEYKVSFLCCVPAIYEAICKMTVKGIEKKGMLPTLLALEEKYKDVPLQEKKDKFQFIHDIFGGNIKYFISGAAALDPEIEQRFRGWGLNMAQGYGLTEASPVIGVGTLDYYRPGSIGRPLPGVKAKVVDCNDEGIGELAVKGDNVMLGYYGDEDATRDTIRDGWLYTGDLARIDEDGFIFLAGRKKNVIVLKNGKNIYPEEIENLLNKIEGITESMVFGKQLSDDKNDIKIYAKIIYNKEIVQNAYKVESDEDVKNALRKKIKDLNQTMPKYKSIKGLYFSEKPLIKTTTNKIKRQANIDEIEKSEE